MRQKQYNEADVFLSFSEDAVGEEYTVKTDLIIKAFLQFHAKI